ncbi:hypothetical protein [Halarcobacter ebronensis]|uniref:PRTase-CE domain-containing protein n=1 Tax=Halarcobacter ebronensis TaxID=1462615 RepID=A0A4Q1ALC5_9BACT|nr:hypothetical protein [Halarcobacter ebronensis]QKF83390.1 hypothetical protein AEBR_2939 [Halarcobacter ebronensis]RXK05950.1 hypothetical protein CRV07_07715 [Halarcobacter ebronensis]
MFKAPEDYEIVYEKIYKKCLKYIELGYWQNLTKKDLDNWLNNFKNDEERYFSILVINKIIYRNEQSILSMLHNTFFIKLPKYLRNKGLYKINDLEDFQEKLFSSSKNLNLTFPLRFSTITTGDLGESGHLYMKLARDNFITRSLIIDVEKTEIDRHVKVLCFIDDFVGSGQQISDFIEDNISKLKNYDLLFIPLIAHEYGIKNILKKAKELSLMIEIQPIESISLENSFFYYNKNKQFLFDNENTIESLHKFYKELIKKRGLKCSSRYGFGAIGTTHIFSTGVPDNNLSIIYKNNDKWKALKEKR